MNPTFHHHHIGNSDTSTDDQLDPNAGFVTDPDASVFTLADPALDSGLLTVATFSSAQSFQPAATTDPISSATSESHGSAAGLVILVNYDTSVTSLMTSNPTLYADYTGAIATAVQFYESEITNPVTITLDLGWGEVHGSSIQSGAVGESAYQQGIFTYAQIYNALKATDKTSSVQLAAVASLPSTDPTNGASFRVSTAEEEALGIASANAGSLGWIGLDSSSSWSWSQSSIASGTYDAVGVLEHEISETLGRSDYGGSTGVYTPLDLFRYTAADGLATDAPGSAAGARDEPFVAGYTATAYSYFSYNGTTVTLPYDTPSQVTAGDDVADWTNSVVGDSYGFAFQGTAGTVSTTDLQEMNVLGYDLACFLPTTRIATPAGEVAVEDLRVGDTVLTYRGEPKPITWIGHGKALATRFRRSATTPVIVRKGALAENVPNRDLRITKGHSLFFGSVLIPAEFLINHRSILWDDRAQEVEVYHIELAEHAVLLANGAPAESYRDDGNRWMFANANAGWDKPPMPACAQILTGGPEVDAIWRRLLARSGPRPGYPFTDDADLHLVVDGRRLDASSRWGRSYFFHLDAPPSTIRIGSRVGSPQELGVARDPRGLGVALRRIIVSQGKRIRTIEADDDSLTEGFHAFEAAAQLRWTKGDAIVPGSAFALCLGGPLEIAICIAGGTTYVDEGAVGQAA